MEEDPKVGNENDEEVKLEKSLSMSETTSSSEVRINVDNNKNNNISSGLNKWKSSPNPNGRTRKARKSLHYSLYDAEVYGGVKKAKRQSFHAVKGLLEEAQKELSDNNNNNNNIPDEESKSLNFLAENVNDPDIKRSSSSSSMKHSKRKRRSVTESIQEFEDLSEISSSGHEVTLDSALESLQFETRAPHFRTASMLYCLSKGAVADKDAMRSDLVDMYPFSFGYYYKGEFLESLTDFCDLKLAKVHHEPMQFWFLVSILGLLLYVIYDIMNFEGTKLTLILITKLGIMIPSLILLYVFTKTKFYWDNKIRRRFITTMTFVVGLSITAYSYQSEGGSYGVFGLFLGIMIIFAPLHFATCCILTTVLWIVYIPAMVASERLRGLKWVQHWLSLGAMCMLFLFYRYKYLTFLQEDVLVSYTMVKQLKRAKHNKEISSLLLSSILPAKIIYRLYRGEKDFADPYDSVTVLFCEVCNFNKLTSLLQTRYGEKDGPRALVRVLNTIYTTFDDMIDEHFVHKVETVGEVYMVVGGAPKKAANHACLATRMALSMIHSMDNTRADLLEIYGEKFANKIDIHIGLNSGPIVAGVCGNKAPRYKLFGDTVNTASRMESTCPYGKVQASPSTVALYPQDVFIVKERGEIQVKGKGVMKPFLVEGINVNARHKMKYFMPVLQEEEMLVDKGEVVNDGVSNEKGENIPIGPDVLKRSIIGSELNLEVDHVQHVIGKRLDKYILESVNNCGYTPSNTRESKNKFIRGGSRLSSEITYRSRISRKSTNVEISRTGFAFAWRAMWGKPYAPATCRCISKKFSEVPTEEVVIEHDLMERIFFDQYQSQYTKSFRVVVLLSIVLVAVGIILDVQRLQNYDPTASSDYCSSEFSNNEKYCIQSYGYNENPSIPLCQWDSNNKICRNTMNVTDNECMWIVQEDASEKLQKQLDIFIIVRFGIFVPIGLIFLGLTFHPKAKEHLADHRCLRCQSIVPLLYYIFAGCALITFSVLGGNPGHFATVMSVTLLLNASYLRLYLRILWAVGYAIAFPFMIYFINFGYRREDYCFSPGNETFTVSQYVFFTIAIILPPIVVRETYLRSAQFLSAEINISNKAYEAEDKRTTNMLLKLLPETIVHELKTREREIIADYFDSVSIVFTDMKGFTAYSSQVSPIELVGFLNRMYNKFDIITDRTNLYKVEIIGDAYYCVGGCPTPSEDHAIKAAESALLMLVAIEDMKIEDPKLMEANVQIRIGVHTGPVIAAVVGVKDPRYHLFGDSVNYAMKMESNGIPGRVHCSDATVNIVRQYWTKKQSDITTFGFEERGLIDVKGYDDKQKTHFIVENTW